MCPMLSVPRNQVNGKTKIESSSAIPRIGYPIYPDSHSGAKATVTVLCTIFSFD